MFLFTGPTSHISGYGLFKHWIKNNNRKSDNLSKLLHISMDNDIVLQLDNVNNHGITWPRTSN